MARAQVERSGRGSMRIATGPRRPSSRRRHVVRDAVVAVMLVIACGLAVGAELGCGGGEAGSADAQAHDAPTVEDAPAPSEPAEPEALEVLFVGCVEVRAGPVCVYEPEPPLRLWAAIDPAMSATLSIDGVAQTQEPTVVEGGLRWEVAVPEGAHRLTIEADLDGTPAAFALALDPASIARAAILDEIAASLEAPAQREPALQRLRAAIPTLPEDQQVLAWEQLGAAVIHDDGLAALQAFERGFALARDQQRPPNVTRIALLAAFVCLRRYDPPCARTWLDRAAPFRDLDPAQRTTYDYYQALLAEQTGDLRAALETYRVVQVQADAVGQTRLSTAVLTQRMMLAGRLGDHAEAQALLTRVHAIEATLEPVVRSKVLNAGAWLLLESRGRGRATVDPSPLLHAALDGLPADDSTQGQLRDAIRLNLAYAAVLDGNPTGAHRWLEAVDEGSLVHVDHLWRQLLQARVARLRGDAAQARRRFAALVEQAERQHEIELRWQALVGQGQTLEALGELEAAVDSYAAAERLVDAQLPRIALQGGRERFVAERDHGMRRLVELRLRLGRPGPALCAARLGRTRALRTLAQQLRSARQLRGTSQDVEPQREALRRYRETRARIEAELDASWTLPAAAARQQRRRLERERHDNQQALDRILASMDPGAADSGDGAAPDCTELPAPEPGALDLHYVALQEGWVGFAVEPDGTITVGRLDLRGVGDPREPSTWQAWSHAVLEPFAAPIDRARGIRVMPTGALAQVPFHALPRPGSPGQRLLHHALVRYGLDLPQTSRPSPSEAARRALVVAPPSNLAHAPAEAEHTQAALRTAGWSVDALAGDAAMGDAVRRELPAVTLLHYVGHARSQGPSGWDSALALARDTSLDVGDVLALPAAPRTVVLDGCETGMADIEALAGGMSLAHAFVLAGSQQVLATSETIDDAAAARLMQALYGAIADGSAETVDTALTMAQRQPGAIEDGWWRMHAWGP